MRRVRERFQDQTDLGLNGFESHGAPSSLDGLGQDMSRLPKSTLTRIKTVPAIPAIGQLFDTII